jgi:hypothetical protein
MKKIVLVSLIALTLQAQGKVDPTYDSVGGDIVCYDAPISAVEKQIGNPTSAQEKEVLEKALELLKKGKQIAQINHKLSCAVYKKDFDMIKIFIKDGASVDALGANGRPALLESCAGEASFEIAKYLIENHANINAQCFARWTALMCASAGGRTDIVKLLLENGADTQLKDGEGRTALWFAENQNRAEVVKLLKENVNIARKPKVAITGNKATPESSGTNKPFLFVIPATSEVAPAEDKTNNLDVAKKESSPVIIIGSQPLCLFTNSGEVWDVPSPVLGTVYKHDKKKNMSLTVIQSTPMGLLVQGEARLGCSGIIMVKTAKEYADDTKLEGGFFKYTGLQEYTTVSGSNKKVYRFEEVEDSSLKVESAINDYYNQSRRSGSRN